MSRQSVFRRDPNRVYSGYCSEAWIQSFQCQVEFPTASTDIPICRLIISLLNFRARLSFLFIVSSFSIICVLVGCALACSLCPELSACDFTDAFLACCVDGLLLQQGYRSCVLVLSSSAVFRHWAVWRPLVQAELRKTVKGKQVENCFFMFLQACFSGKLTVDDWWTRK
jgi:hypothetical protein